jgi:hypothetical protein
MWSLLAHRRGLVSTMGIAMRVRVLLGILTRLPNSGGSPSAGGAHGPPRGPGVLFLGHLAIVVDWALGYETPTT